MSNLKFLWPTPESEVSILGYKSNPISRRIHLVRSVSASMRIEDGMFVGYEIKMVPIGPIFIGLQAGRKICNEVILRIFARKIIRCSLNQ